MKKHTMKNFDGKEVEGSIHTIEGIDVFIYKNFPGSEGTWLVLCPVTGLSIISLSYRTKTKAQVKERAAKVLRTVGASGYALAVERATKRMQDAEKAKSE